MQYTLLLVSLVLAAGPALCGAKQLAMKVVETPTNLGVNNIYQQQQRGSVGGANAIKLRVPPANFTGPPHLQYLQGRCYKKVVGDYRYELCPFDNVTQEELTLRWNTYHGVLGVWRYWTITNYSFSAMNMEDGDPCGGGGTQFRSTKVMLVCGNRTELDSVAEPSTCRYELRLNTPLVCHPAALLVYPTLGAQHQAGWDRIEADLRSGYITRQGYDKRLHRLLVGAGLVLEIDSVRAEQQRITRSNKLEQAHFDSLMECQAEYRALRTEINALKASLTAMQEAERQRNASTAGDGAMLERTPNEGQQEGKEWDWDDDDEEDYSII